MERISPCFKFIDIYSVSISSEYAFGVYYVCIVTTLKVWLRKVSRKPSKGGRCIDSLTPEAHPPMEEKFYCFIEESIERMSSI